MSEFFTIKDVSWLSNAAKLHFQYGQTICLEMQNADAENSMNLFFMPHDSSIVWESALDHLD